MLREWLNRGPLLTDGAWGTELQKHGLEPGLAPDAWNLDHPERVEQVARSYVEAGSRVILTNTFRANPLCLSNRVDQINRAGVAISRRAAHSRALVFASIGPSGKMLAAGDVSPDELHTAFARQAGALAEAGADALLIETMSDPGEARIAVRAALPFRLPVIVSFVFDTGRRKDRTMTGATPEQVAAAMAEEGADGIGANCGSGIEAFEPVCARLRAACDLPVWIKPNAGLPQVTGNGVAYATTPAEFASHVPALLRAGASFLGGCCGSTPDFIRAMAARMQPCA